MPNDYIEGVTVNGTDFDLQDKGSVRYDTTQPLTDNQKAQARENIKAAAPDGSYGGMTVGYAEQLTSSIVETDEAPYLFRTAGGNAEIGNYEEDTIVGGSVAWNQMVPAIGNLTKQNHVTSWSVSDGVATINADGNTSNYGLYCTPAFVTGHKYVVSMDARMDSPRTGMVARISAYQDSSYARSKDAEITSSWTRTRYIYANDIMPVQLRFGVRGDGGDAYTYQLRNIMLTDLTQMFGTQIADYVYSLEQANEGSGIAWLKANGFFTEDYYPYNAGGMKHVSGLVSHDMVGFNAWDEEWEVGGISSSTGNNISQERVRSKNYIRLIVGASYSVTNGTGHNITCYWYDYNKNYITSASIGSSRITPILPQYPYMRFVVPNQTTYANDICLNLRWDGERDGEYEAYRKESYALDSSVVLRGRLELDASNNLRYNGDRYLHDGTVERLFKEDILDDLVWDTRYTGSVNKAISARLSANYTHEMMRSIISNYAYNGIAYGANDFSSPDDKKAGIYTYYNQSSSANDNLIYLVLPINSNPSGSIVYKLATPTTETAAPYTNPQWVDNWGTEEYVVTPDADGFRMPVGHETNYPVDLKAKLEATANNPQTDGIYLLQYQNGEATYTPLASDSTITDILARLTALEQQTAQEG